MERTLLEANGPDPTWETGANWHYRLTIAGHRFTQHIFHYPTEGIYRMRIFYYPPRIEGDYREEELWTFEAGTFAAPEVALEVGATVVQNRVKSISPFSQRE